MSTSKSEIPIENILDTDKTVQFRNTKLSNIGIYFIRTREHQKCKLCSNIYGRINITSTGTLKKHLKQNHIDEYNKIFKETNQNIISYTYQENFKKTKYLINWIITSIQPFSVMSESIFIKMINNFDPRYKIPCRKFVKNYIMKKFMIERKKLKYYIKKIKSKVSLTTDMWTSENNHVAFLGITCHYLDDNWILNNFLLDIIPFYGSHTSLSMSTVLLNLINKFDLSSKILGLTTDNASSMIATGKSMTTKLKLMNNYDFTHYRCGAHILNIAVQHGLQVCDQSVDKVRKFMNKVKNSNKLLEDFKKIFKSQSISFLLPQLDINIRWNSTFLMIEKFIKMKTQVNILMAQHLNEFENINFENNDWNTLNVSLVILY